MYSHIKRRGSITIIMSLMLSLMVSLVCASLTSVKMASARTQILNGMDIGLYSLFGQYDRKILEDYELFTLDGSCGGGELKLAEIYDNMISYMEPILKQNSQRLSLERGGFTGYRLLTDEGGKAFYQQIVNYMQETLGSQGIQLLLKKMQDRKEKIEYAEKEGKKAESGKTLESYDSAVDQATQASKEAVEQGTPGGNSVQQPAEQPAKNPIAVIRRIMKMGILELVIPSRIGISEKESDTGAFVSRRELQKGLTILDGLEADYSYTGKLLFQQYLMNHLGNFRKPSGKGLDYQMEYILGGKGKDMDNLKTVARKLLFVREGINFACLAADAKARAQIEALALAIASGFLIPPATSAIAAALMVCWSFAESILDVRELFDGGRVPLVKRMEQWQLSLENLPHLLDGLDSARKGSKDGMSYEDYLQVFLLAHGNEKKIMRAMDMVELSLRSDKGQMDFRLDSCIASIEASVDVEANKMKKYNVIRQYCYE